MSRGVEMRQEALAYWKASLGLRQIVQNDNRRPLTPHALEAAEDFIVELEALNMHSEWVKLKGKLTLELTQLTPVLFSPLSGAAG